MAVFSSAQLAILTGGLSLGYVVFGVALLRRYSGIGVRSLNAFAVLWGINFALASLVIYLLSSVGITSGTQIRVDALTALPSSLQLVFISSTPLSGLLTVAGIFAWLWFVLEYTRRIDREEKISIAILGGFTFVVATLNGLVGALSAFGVIDIPRTLEGNFHNFASVVEVLGTGVAVGIGIALLYATSQRHRPFTEGALLGLSVPILLPYLVRYLYQFALIPGFRSISVLRGVSLLVGLAGLWLTVTRYDLFEQLPASRTVGRQTAFDATDTPIVVVNNEGDVSDLNPAARELFDARGSGVVGSPFETVLPETVAVEDFEQPRSVTFGFPNSDTVVEAETTVTTDDNGRAIGQTVVFNEITEERRRQQRIQVLNRVLRHNLRNDINAASGYVDVLTDGGADTEEYKIKVKSILHDLVKVGNKARDTERVLAADPLSDTPHPLSEVVARAVDSVQTDHDDVTVVTDIPSGTVVWITPLVLQSVVAELVENAAEHTATAEIQISYDTDGQRLIVADDGPGVPRHEIDVLDSARETSLEHGSGLGLWLVKWGTDMFGGTVEFETVDGGSRVFLALPPDLVEREAAAETA